jgi:hypothetical protein
MLSHSYRMAKTHLRHKETMYDEDGDDGNLGNIHFEVYIGETNSLPLDKSYPSEWIVSYKDSQWKLHMVLEMMSTLVSSWNKRLRLPPGLECNQQQSAMSPL